MRGRLHNDDPPSTFVLCRRWDSNPHEVALTGFRVRPAQGQGQTPRDAERQNRAFIGGFGSLKGTGKDTRLRSVAVKTWDYCTSRCQLAFRHPELALTSTYSTITLNI